MNERGKREEAQMKSIHEGRAIDEQEILAIAYRATRFAHGIFLIDVVAESLAT